MGYAVYHTEKGKISSGGIGNHIDRKEGAEHTYKHSDPAKRNLNQSFAITEHCRKPLHQAIADRISEGYSAKNKAGELKQIRKDAVKYSTHILTGTHEDMKRIEANPEELKKWVEANLKFVSKEFGKENIVRFVLHRDEKTPHLHVVTVNLTKDGRLSAKEILGNPKAMQERQDRYAEQMKSFGLERGLKNTGIEHEDAKTYYARMKESLDETKHDKIEVKKGVFSVDFGRTNEKTIERLSRENKALKTAKKAKELELSKLKKQEKESAEYKGKLLQANKNLSSALTESLLNDRYRMEVIEQKKKELGEKYGYALKSKFHFVSNSIQKKSNEEIGEMVISAVKSVAKEKNLTETEAKLLSQSQQVKNQYESLLKERERRNEIDLNRGRGMRM